MHQFVDEKSKADYTRATHPIQQWGEEKIRIENSLMVLAKSRQNQMPPMEFQQWCIHRFSLGMKHNFSLKKINSFRS
jgi:hypothetical protein